MAKKKSEILVVILGILALAQLASAEPTIYGDMVFIDDSRAFISASPHTLDFSGLVTFTVNPKTYTGNINALWGFDTSVSKPTKAEYYKKHNVTQTLICNRSIPKVWFSYTLNPKHVKCWRNITQLQCNAENTSCINVEVPELIWEHSFYKADLARNMVFYNITKNWMDITDRFQSRDVVLDNKDKWFYVTDIPVVAGQIYTVRAYVKTPMCLRSDTSCNSYGKYDFAVYPSSYGSNIGQAYADNNLYLLDPWWNTTWSYRRLLHNISHNVSLLPINASSILGLTMLGSDGDSDIDNNWNSEWPYAENCSLTNMSIYFDSDSAIGAVVNGTNDVCYWFSSTNLSAYGGTTSDELIEYLPMDRNETANETVGYGLNKNATISSATHNRTGAVNRSMYFNDKGSRLQLGIISQLENAQHATVSMWVRDNSLGGDDCWFCRHSAGTGNVFSLWTANADTKLYICIDGCVTYGNIAYNAIVHAGTWNHYVVRYDGTKADSATRLQLYINGTNRTLAYTGVIPSFIDNTGKSFCIGNDCGVDGFYFGGSVDDFRIYNRTLTPQEIYDLYELGAYLGEKGNEQEPPTLYWDWTDANSTTWENYTTVVLNLSEPGNCTLYSNITGTKINYTNLTVGTQITWNFTNIPSGNYTFEAVCDDVFGNRANSSIVWWSVDHANVARVAFTVTTRIWEEIEKKILERTNNTIVVERNYDIELIDPYINELGWILYVDLDHNATNKYVDCNIPFASVEKSFDWFNYGNWMGDNLTVLYKNLSGGFALCDKYWFRGEYINGTANVTLYWPSNYTIFFVSGTMTFENNVSPPHITHGDITIPFGVIEFSNASVNYEVDLYVSHDELDWWKSLTSSLSAWVITLFPLILFFFLLLAGFGMRLSLIIAIGFPSIVMLMSMLGFL